MRRSPDASRLTPGRALPLQMRRLRLRKAGVRPATGRPAQTAGGLSGDSELWAVWRVSAASVQPTGFRTRLATGRPLPHGMRGRKRRLKAPQRRGGHRTGVCVPVSWEGPRGRACEELRKAGWAEGRAGRSGVAAAANPVDHTGRGVVVSGEGPAPQCGPTSRRGGQDSA